MHIVYLYGRISFSTVYILDEKCRYPERNQYAEIKQCLLSVGGDAANSAIMLSKLDIKTKLDGSWISKRTSNSILNILNSFNIDISSLKIDRNYGSEEIIIIDNTSRTIFGNYYSIHSGVNKWNTPNKMDIRNASLISLDPYFGEESIKVAELCKLYKKAYVTIDCRYNEYIAQNAEVIIISQQFLQIEYQNYTMLQIFKKYQKSCQGLVIFTCGSSELWYSRLGKMIKKCLPYKIKPIDTTSAGDSFRAGIIYGILNSWNDESTVQFASAVAACVCLTTPHTLNAPCLGGILRFMEERSET